MLSPGWTRRLDARVDQALRRRFGWGLSSAAGPTSGQFLLVVSVALVALGLVLLVAEVISGETARHALLGLWPLLASPAVLAAGQLWSRRKRS